MNIDLARIAARSCFRSSRELSELLSFLGEHLPTDEAATYSKAIGTAIASIQVEVMNRIVAAQPGLEMEIERAVETYGRF